MVEKSINLAHSQGRSMSIDQLGNLIRLLMKEKINAAPTKTLLVDHPIDSWVAVFYQEKQEDQLESKVDFDSAYQLLFELNPSLSYLKQDIKKHVA